MEPIESSYADTHTILYTLEHGFRKGIPCELQLIDFIDDIIKNIDTGKQINCLMMDLSKTFDKISLYL